MLNFFMKGIKTGGIPPLQKIFTACLEGVLRKLVLERTVLRINGEYFGHLRFADDSFVEWDCRTHTNNAGGTTMRKHSRGTKKNKNEQI